MKKILVITDNPCLLEYFMDCWNLLNLNKNGSYCIRYSKKNRSPLLLLEHGAKPIDLNVEADLQFAKKFDIIFSIHCKQIFPDVLVKEKLCINLHPGYNPYGRGWYPQVFSIINGTPAGATLHVMDEFIDAGMIIDRTEVVVKDTDTSLTVYHKVIEAEKKLLLKNLLGIIENKYNTFAPEVEGVVNSIADFDRLCHLNIKHIGSLESHIKLLRALTHGDFKNAYYINEFNKRIYIKIDLVEDQS